MRVEGWLLGMGIGAVYAWQDIKKREISWRAAAAGAGASLLYVGILRCSGKITWQELFMGWTTGGFTALLAFLTRNQIGYADALALWIWGNCIGQQGSFAVFLIGVILEAVIGMIGILCKKYRWQSRLAFLPFLSLGGLIWGIGRFLCSEKMG